MLLSRLLLYAYRLILSILVLTPSAVIARSSMLISLGVIERPSNISSIRNTLLNSYTSSAPDRHRFSDFTSWPTTPFQVLIPTINPPHPETKIKILSAYPVVPSQLARKAIMTACYDMINWIDTFPPLFESYICTSHTIIHEFDDSGIVTLDLVPGLDSNKLSRRLALRGFEVFRALVGRYGEAELRFELSQGGLVRGRGRVNVRS